MTACRDKATSRRLFAEHDVPSATSTRVDTLAQATAAAFRTGFPVVLKPSSHAASIGVVRADTPEELPSAWRFASAGAGEQGPEGSGVLVEEYLFGPEISVECVTQHGVTTALAVTRKEVAFLPTSRRSVTPSMPATRSCPRSPLLPSRRSGRWASPAASSTSRCASLRPVRGSSRSTRESAAT